MRFFNILKSLLQLFTISTLISCDSLSIFVPPSSPSSLSDFSDAQINGQGFLQLAWKNNLKTSRAKYEVYEMSLDEDDPLYRFSASAKTDAPLTHESLEVAAGEDTPRTKGQLLATVTDPSFVFSDLLIPGHMYAIQVVQKGTRRPIGNQKVLLAKVDFAPFSAASGSSQPDGVQLSWNSVAGANRYVVYADEVMSTVLGETTSTSITLSGDATKALKTYYVQAFRGALASPDITRINVQKNSDVKVVRVSAITANGLYKAGDALDLAVTFSKPVTPYGTTSLPLTIGSSGQQASYISGSGSTTLNFRYTVQAGDNSDRLASGQVLIGTFVDDSGNQISGELPLEGQSNTLQENSQIAIDTLTPTPPTLIVFSQVLVSNGQLTAQWTSGNDLHFDHDEVKLCAHSTCDSDCLASSQATAANMNFTGMSDGTYYACVRSVDSLAQTSAWAASLIPATVDTIPPAIHRIYALSANGLYKEGQTLNIAVEFSEPVTVAGGSDISLLLETGTTDHSAIYQSGSGTNLLTFSYTVQAGDTSSALNSQSTSALHLGASGSIEDPAGSSALLSLPALNAANALAGQSAIVLDTTAPTDPSAVAFTTASPAPTAGVGISWTASTDTNFKQHNVRLCPASDCVSSCLSSSVVPSGTAATLTGSNGGTYYACAQGEDTLGHLSAWKASATSLTINTTIPTVTLVKATNADGVYKEGQTLDIVLQFNDAVRVTGNPKITLATGSTNHDMVYSSGDGTQNLTFTYTVQSGDTSARLNYLSTNALYLNGGTLKSVSGNNADLTLPALASANSLASQSQIILDTTAPTEASAVSFTSASPSSSTSLAFNWTASTDTNFKQHNIKLCTDNFCSVACTGINSLAGTSGSVSGTAGNAYYACVQGEDRAGHLSAWVHSASTVSIDTTAPTVINVTSSAANGYYTTGQNLSVAVQFSEPVLLAGGTPTLRLATGSTLELAPYSSMSGSDTLLFTYTVQAGDVAANLDSASTTALILNGATLRDAAGNDADLTLPTPGSGTSLGGQKAIVIDTTAPTVPTSPGFSSSTSYTSAVSLSWGVSTDTNFSTHNIKLCTANDCNTGCLSASTSVGSPVTLVGTNGSTYYGCVQGQDAAGQTSAWVASLGTVLINSNQPTILNVSSSKTNGLYKVGATIPITIQFSKVVNVTSSGSFGLLLETGTTDRTASYVSGDGTDTLTFQYVAQAGDATSDLEYHDVNAFTLGGGTIQDSGGNNAELQLPPPQSSNSLGGQKDIAIDTTAPTVTNVSSTQANGSYKVGAVIPIRVQFSEAVNLTNSSSLGLLLETGSTDRTATYSSGDGTSVLVFSYTVQAGDTSPDLEYQSTSALTLGTGSIKDAAGNDATLTLPTLNSATSLAGQKALVIDTTAPAAPVISSPGNGSYSAAAITTVSGTGEANANLELKDGSTTIGTTTVSGGGSWSITLGNALAEGSHSLTATVTDAAQNVSPTSSTTTAIVDTTAPAAPSSVGFASPIGNTTSFSMSWSNSTDTNFSTHNAKICTASDCTTGCISSTTATSSPVTMTGVNGTSYYGCVQGLDLAGNTSAWINSTGTMTVDTTAPTVTNVTSSKANGLYTVVAVIPIQVKFSEAVYVTSSGSLGLLLETGTTDRTATYSSGSGSDTLTFSYTVQAGDTSADLEYQSTSALTVGAGSIKDAAGNNATLTLPNLNSANSMAGQKALVIDTTAPNAPVFTSPVNSSTVTAPIYSVAGSAEANSTITISESSNSLGTATADGSGNWSLTLPSPYMNGTFTFKAVATDAAGNASAAGSSLVTVAIPVPTVNAGPDIASNTSSTLVGTVSDAVSYQWSKVSGSGTVSFGSSTSTTTSVSVSAQGTYVLRLTATNVAGVTATDDMTFVYDVTAPTFLGITDVRQLSSTSVRIFWQAAYDNLTSDTGITYELCYSATLGSCASSFVANYSFNSSNWEKTFTGLTAGTTYEFLVRAIDQAGNISYGAGARQSNGLRNVQQIVGGGYFACALISDGTVKCWGNNQNYQLGLGGTDSTNRNSPVTVGGLSGVSKIGAGTDHACAILSDKTVKCWGYNNHGQIGDGTTSNRSSPTTVSGLSDIVDIALGLEHSCALNSSGTVYCWGNDGNGQLGNGSTSDSSTPVAVSGLSSATALAAGNYFNCAILSDKSLRCWGKNHRGQLGNGTINDSSTIVMPSISNVANIELAEAYACAINTSGAVYCWGYYASGGLGLGSLSADVKTPTAVPSITSGASKLALGYAFSCALMTDGSGQCWGNNDWGQLGNETLTSSNVPVSIHNFSGATSIAAGNDFACATFSDGYSRCWGRDDSGHLGNGNLPERWSPVLVSGINNAVSVQTGNDHSCVLLSDKTVQCWGSNEKGQIGQPVFSYSNFYPTPTTMPGLSDVVLLKSGTHHNCVILSDTTVKCWGWNADGELGNNSTTDSITPQTVLSSSGSGSLSGAVDLIVGDRMSCAILSDGTMQCWGYSGTGMLGEGSSSITKKYPVVSSSFNAIGTVKSGTIGLSHICVVYSDKTVRCVGKNDRAQIGDNTTTDKTAPTSPSGLTGVASVSSGGDSTCALLIDSTVRCWGYNNVGQLGKGTISTYKTPQTPSGITTVSAVATGSNFICFVLTDGTMKCSGENNSGRLGYPNIAGDVNQTTPVPFFGLTNATSNFSLGMAHGCMVLANQSVICWGDNYNSQLSVNANNYATISPGDILTNFNMGD